VEKRRNVASEMPHFGISDATFERMQSSKASTPESSQEDSRVLALEDSIPSQPQLQYLALD
jgi:hypothetical protein